MELLVLDSVNKMRSFFQECYIRSTKSILRSNNFKIDQKYCSKVGGTAMGTKCTPPYLC